MSTAAGKEVLVAWQPDAVYSKSIDNNLNFIVTLKFKDKLTFFTVYHHDNALLKTMDHDVFTGSDTETNTEANKNDLDRIV